MEQWNTFTVQKRFLPKVQVPPLPVQPPSMTFRCGCSVAAVWLHVASKPPKVNNAPGKMREVLQTCDFCVASTASAAHSCEVNQLTGKARISDVIRSRFNAWKPDKSQAQRIPAHPSASQRN